MVIILISIFLLPITAVQAFDLSGEWVFSIINTDKIWDGSAQVKVSQHNATILPVEFSDDTEPNYYIDLAGTDDDFIGFVRENTFAFYKENLDNCGGPEVNFGREIITGIIFTSVESIIGKGMGFDSNIECGGTWFYQFRGKKYNKKRKLRFIESYIKHLQNRSK
jgi:hypothetical protein